MSGWQAAPLREFPASGALLPCVILMSGFRNGVPVLYKKEETGADGVT